LVKGNSMLWMDISRDDFNDVNSVVVGCDVDGLRSVNHDIPDASAWLTRHYWNHHASTESRAVQQIGCAHQRIAPVRSDALRLVLAAGRPVPTHEIADTMGKGYSNVYRTLLRLSQDGQIQKAKVSHLIYWSAPDRTEAA
jgi:hypothetical protein